MFWNKGVPPASFQIPCKSDSLFSAAKGVIANLSIRPPKAAKAGNDARLGFGRALLRKIRVHIPESEKHKRGMQADGKRFCIRIMHDKGGRVPLRICPGACITPAIGYRLIYRSALFIILYEQLSHLLHVRLFL
jgi:hypothetical protein